MRQHQLNTVEVIFVDLGLLFFLFGNKGGRLWPVWEHPSRSFSFFILFCFYFLKRTKQFLHCICLSFSFPSECFQYHRRKRATWQRKFLNCDDFVSSGRHTLRDTQTLCSNNKNLTNIYVTGSMKGSFMFENGYFSSSWSRKQAFRSQIWIFDELSLKKNVNRFIY